MEIPLPENGTKTMIHMGPDKTNTVVSSGTEDFDVTLTQTTPEDLKEVQSNNNQVVQTLSSNPHTGSENLESNSQPQVKRQRLESLHSKSSNQQPWSRGIINGFSASNTPEPQKREVISLSSSEDEAEDENDNKNLSSSDDEIEVLDENEAARVSWKNTSFEMPSLLQPQDNVQIGSSTSHQRKLPSSIPVSQVLPVKNIQPKPANIQKMEPQFNFNQLNMSNVNNSNFNQNRPYTIPGTFPSESTQQNTKIEPTNNNDIEVLNSRIVPTNQGNTPFAFNTPAPVPHAGDMDVNREKKRELTQREGMKRLEIVQWENQKQKVIKEISVAKSVYDKYSQMARQLEQGIRQAVSLGNHNDAAKFRAAIQKNSERIKSLKHKINKGTQLVMKLEQAIRLILNELAMISSNLRQLEHASTAVFNPYAAQIMNETIQRFVPMGPKVEDVDLKNLLDNIRPDEESEEGLDPTPVELGVALLKHQRMGLTWMKRMEASKSKGGILADDMGLGKTIQTLSLILANSSKDEECKTNLIIAPVSLLRQWAAEIESKTRPQVYKHVGIFHSDEKKKMPQFELMKKYDIVLVSYTTLALEWKRHFKEELDNNKKENRTFMPNSRSGGKSYCSPFFANDANFYRIILDEAQAIKNKLGLASRAVTYLKATYRFCLTGTPMQNNIEELYPIIRFLKIQPYCVEEKFKADISVPLKNKTNNYDEYDMRKSMKKLRALLRAILLRRTKDSLIDGKPILNLPEKHIASDYVTLENEELDYYQSIEEGIQKVARKMLASNIRNGGVLTMLLRLRQACCHSYLVEIGQYKAKMKKDDEASGNLNVHWHQMLNNVHNIKPDIKAKVLELSEASTATSLIQSEDDTISCPVCFDALDFESSILIFGECGHMICKTCGPSFFEEQDDDENLKNRSGECKDCKKTVKEQNLMEYILFKKIYIDNLSSTGLREFCLEHYERKTKSNQTLISEFVKRDNGFEPSAKIQKCIEIIQEITQANSNEKIIVFSQFTTLFDLLKLVLHYQKIPFLRYDGTMNMESKNTVIKEFYKSDTRVLLLSLRSGNAGLTLTCANHIIIMDPFWNPYVEDQAMGRAHRIGQEREVHVHRVLIEGTVESRIMELQEHKKELIGEALDESKMKSISQLDRRELGFLFGLNGLTEDRPQQAG